MLCEDRQHLRTGHRKSLRKTIDFGQVLRVDLFELTFGSTPANPPKQSRE
jgi:hypothetical protein